MAFNKIQPEQIQQPTFFSDSGDFNLSQSDTGVRLNLSKGLTGDFTFTGSLLTNGRSVFGLANTGQNFFITDNNCLLLNGANTQIRGTGNNAFLADGSTISGVNNVAVNVNTANFIGNSAGTAERNTALHGRGITFGSSTTGSVVLKDFTSSSQSATQNHSFYANFESGHFFRGGQASFEKSVGFAQSGVFSGSLEVIGSGFLSGEEIITKDSLESYASGNYADLSQDQTIGGEKTITSQMRFLTGFQIPKWEGTNSQAGPSTAPATGALAISGTTLCVFVGGSSWAGIAISGGTI